MRDKVIIKRYANRRLYDTNQSCYINMDDLSALLKRGQDVEVRDASTAEDITAAVLLQVIIDREKRHVSGLPVGLLKELIVLQDTPGKRWFDLAMEQSLQFIRQMRGAGWQLPNAASSRFFDPSFWLGQVFPDGKRQGGGEPSVSFSESAPDFDPPPVEPEPVDAKADERDTLSEELSELRRRLEQLESRSKKGKKKGKS